jgi:hypothetical protein
VAAEEKPASNYRRVEIWLTHTLIYHPECLGLRLKIEIRKIVYVDRVKLAKDRNAVIHTRSNEADFRNAEGGAAVGQK